MDTKDLIADLRSQIKPAYAMWPGTESYERRECVEALEAQAAEIERLQAQRDAWKEVAEHQYGLQRIDKFMDADYKVTGALDAWAAGRYPVLKDC